MAKACRPGISPYIPLPVAPVPSHRQHMTQASLDVVGIGNAIVDVIAHAEDAFLGAAARTSTPPRPRPPICAFSLSVAAEGAAAGL